MSSEMEKDNKDLKSNFFSPYIKMVKGFMNILNFEPRLFII